MKDDDIELVQVWISKDDNGLPKPEDVRILIDDIFAAIKKFIRKDERLRVVLIDELVHDYAKEHR